MSAWSHLPNSHHIDWVIESVKQNPQLWAEARRESWDTAPLDGAQAAAVAARILAWNSEKDWAARVATWNAGEVWEVILALVAYDDCDQYLKMNHEKLQVYAILSEKPQAIMLLPMTYVKEKLNEHMVAFT